MTFIWPWILISLLAVPLCIFIYMRMQRRRARNAADLGTLGSIQGSQSPQAGTHRHIAPILFLIALSLLIVASARPQLNLPLPKLEGTVMLTFDVSASMAAEDAEPTRMEAAKAAAKAFVERRPDSTKIGVVAFGEGGLVVQPPTDDIDALSATIDRLVPQSGTSLGRGIMTALNIIAPPIDPEPQDGMGPSLPQSFEPPARTAFAPAVIVLLTDGENTDQSDPMEAAQTAIDRGVRVYTVGVGSVEGFTLEIDGFYTFTQLNEPVLREIASLTEGSYFNIAAASDIPSIYEKLENEFVVEPREVEITGVLGGLSALVLLAGATMSLFWFGRVP